MIKAHILLEDGTIFDADANIEKTVLGELVFNTSMTGYQEILTDASYSSQIVVMTYPLIGNYGINPEFTESKSVKVNGFIIKENSEIEENKKLSDYLTENNVLCLSNIDTRNLTRIIRSSGCHNCLLTTEEIQDKHYKMLEEYSFPKDIIPMVSENKIRKIKTTKTKKSDFALIDLGAKEGIIKCLTNDGSDVTVYPYNTDAETILQGKHDAVILSNGPGNPKDVPTVIETVKCLTGKIRLFGICLGHQILALSLGANTYKMKFGHRGGNHPVINLQTGNVIITSQNHGYAVEENSMPDFLEITYKNINDNTVEGFKHKELPVEGVQFHPEAGPGPNDASEIFNRWIETVAEEVTNA